MKNPYEEWEYAMGRIFDSIPCGDPQEPLNLDCDCEGCRVHRFFEELSPWTRASLFSAFAKLATEPEVCEEGGDSKGSSCDSTQPALDALVDRLCEQVVALLMQLAQIRRTAENSALTLRQRWGVIQAILAEE